MLAVAIDAITVALAALASVMAATGVASLRRYFYAAHPYTWPLLLWLLPLPAAAFIPWHRPALGGAMLVVGGAILIYAGVREFQRAIPREWAPTMSYRGEVGLLALVAMLGAASAVAQAVGGNVASIIAFAAVLSCCLGLIAAEERTTRRGFVRLKRRVEDARVVDRTADPDVKELVLGRCEGHEISIALLGEVIRIGVHLPQWPSELHLMAVAECKAAEQRTQARRPTTGDATFDALIAIEGADDLWRPILTAPVRARLATLIGDMGATIEPRARWLTVVVPSAALGRMNEALDTALELARLLSSVPADSKQWILESSQEEPDRAVRWSNYRWLVESSWNTALVFRTAATDPDREIAEWARAHVSPADGPFR